MNMGAAKTMTLDSDEVLVIEKFRHAKKQQHGELTATIRHGRLVKLWTTDKWDVSDTSRSDHISPTLREIGGGDVKDQIEK